MAPARLSSRERAGREERPARSRPGIVLALAAVMGLGVGAAPAVAGPCDKATGKAPAQLCRPAPAPSTSDASTPADAGKGNGKGHAYGHANKEGAGSGSGSAGSNAGGASNGGSGGGHGDDAAKDHGGAKDGSGKPAGDHTGTKKGASGSGPGTSGGSQSGAAWPAIHGVGATSPDAATSARTPLVGATPNWELGDAEGILVQEGSPQVRSTRFFVATALSAAESLAFPMTLTILVMLFLLVQALFDRNDPKLREAAVRREVYDFD